MSLSARIIVGVVVAFLVVFGLALIYFFFDQRGQSEALSSRGVETTATVLSTEEVTPVKGGSYTRADVVFETGSGTRRAEIRDCSERAFPESAETVAVVYVPDEPELVRLSGCAGPSLAALLALIFGIAVLVLDAVIIRAITRSWARKQGDRART